MVSFFLGAVLSQVWSVANILQIITHYPLVGIPLASNVVDIFAIINICVTFDFIPSQVYDFIVNNCFELVSDIPFNAKFA